MTWRRRTLQHAPRLKWPLSITSNISRGSWKRKPRPRRSQLGRACQPAGRGSRGALGRLPGQAGHSRRAAGVRRAGESHAGQARSDAATAVESAGRRHAGAADRRERCRPARLAGRRLPARYRHRSTWLSPKCPSRKQTGRRFGSTVERRNRPAANGGGTAEAHSVPIAAGWRSFATCCSVSGRQDLKSKARSRRSTRA